ncbi:MAG TPA: hypothetical protein VFL36_16270 [Myxococcales bacterium]|nr:hypothetical protein [Myxococcales bacterium]
MRLEARADGAVRCGGFRLLFEDGAPLLRLVPGERSLPQGLPEAVLQGLSDAPRLLAGALRLLPPPRPYDRVEVALGPGESTHGEALCVGEGCIRLSLGETTPPDDASRIARHEALHLLLASALRARERWNDPELAFADWIVRGIECGLDAQVPRFQPPLPQLLDPVPTSRVEVQRQLGAVASAPAAARRYFGEALFSALAAIEGGDAAAVEQRRLWLVEAALGTHYLEAAARLQPEDGAPLHAILLDDWLLDYEQYARAVGNPPSAAGNLWRLSEAGWSRDPVTRLSVAAQAMQRDDHCWFAGDRFSHVEEPVVWKARGRVRLPLLPSSSRPRAAPIHGFRAVLRDLPEGAQALALAEEAARGNARSFEARVLWPRVLARLLAAELPLPAVEAVAGVVQLVDGADSAQAFEEWKDAAEALRALLREAGAWVPGVARPRHAATLLEAPRAAVSGILVHAAPLDGRALLAARRLAARGPLRSALFLDLGGGKAYERQADLEAPLDPRYREEAWTRGDGVPRALADLPAAVDEATGQGRLTTPLSHLLAAVGIGLEECHYPGAQR